MKFNTFHVFASLAFLFVANLGISQTTQNLVGFFPFSDCATNDHSPTAQHEAKFLPNPAAMTCDCGVQDTAVYFDGIINQMVFLGTVNNQFTTTDFTLSFYFKAFPKAGMIDLISKKSDCDNGPGLAIRYRSNSNELFVYAVQDANKKVAFEHIELDRNNCWHHIALVREGNTISLYTDGIFRGSKTTPSRVNMKNNSTLNISGGPCLGVTTTAFRGLIDEFRVYNRALAEQRVKELYSSPDKIVNRDTIIYLGESVQLNSNSPCGLSYQWNPTGSLDGDDVPNPIATPLETTTYEFQVNSGGGCTAKDTVRITVVDPNDVDCRTLLFPTAFTPERDKNSTFSFDTPTVVLDEFKLLEIFDRWGNRVFYTTDSSQRWDGTYGDKQVNPGVFLYRTQFVCRGKEEVQVGQVTLIR